MTGQELILGQKTKAGSLKTNRSGLDEDKTIVPTTQEETQSREEFQSLFSFKKKRLSIGWTTDNVWPRGKKRL